MKKLALFAFLAALVAVAAALRKSRSAVSPEERAARRETKRRQMFEKMRAGMESMPEDFPPRVMFDNVAVTRKNSERILELLEGDNRESESVVSPTT